MVQNLVEKSEPDKIIKQELLITLLNKAPELLSNKISEIQNILKNKSITTDQLKNSEFAHKLFNNIEESRIEHLFKEISGLDIIQVWKEQKLFILAKQIYVASTTYGENTNACFVGTCTQIIESSAEIKSSFLNEYTDYKKLSLIKVG